MSQEMFLMGWLHLKCLRGGMVRMGLSWTSPELIWNDPRARGEGGLSHSDGAFVSAHNTLVSPCILFLRDDLRYRDWKMNPVLELSPAPKPWSLKFMFVHHPFGTPQTNLLFLKRTHMQECAHPGMTDIPWYHMYRYSLISYVQVKENSFHNVCYMGETVGEITSRT